MTARQRLFRDDEPAVLLQRIDDSAEPAYGDNAATRSHRDLPQMGVMNPAKVTQLALQSAGAIVGLVLTTDGTIANAPVPQSMSGPAPPDL